jgi:5-methylcytosine-specific restriction protein A
MPRLLQRCWATGCDQVQYAPYCELHSRDPWSGRGKPGEQAARRPRAKDGQGYDWAWRRTRARKLRTDADCERCGAEATTVHHIDGLGPNGPAGHHMPNLEALCASCHNAVSGKQRWGVV